MRAKENMLIYLHDSAVDYNSIFILYYRFETKHTIDYSIDLRHYNGGLQPYADIQSICAYPHTNTHVGNLKLQVQRTMSLNTASLVICLNYTHDTSSTYSIYCHLGSLEFMVRGILKSTFSA